MMVARNRPSSRRSPRRVRSHPTVFALLCLTRAPRPRFAPRSRKPASIRSRCCRTTISRWITRAVPFPNFDRFVVPCRSTAISRSPEPWCSFPAERIEAGCHPQPAFAALRHTRRNVAVPEIPGASCRADGPLTPGHFVRGVVPCSARDVRERRKKGPSAQHLRLPQLTSWRYFPDSATFGYTSPL